MAMTNDDPIRRNVAVNVVWYGVIHHLNVVTINVPAKGENKRLVWLVGHYCG